ncbi:DNA methyltransferase [Nostoc sp.]|uniref:DNA methyltransferase n=1 Tax=Nostoc sp. TaxID=1180 RepID=UPI002FFB6A5F
MSDMIASQLSFKTATGRWSGLGPYYAMFPREFAFKVVENYSKPGDAVIDPFAGRASSIYAAAVMKRSGCGIEINPVGWLYGYVKLEPASKDSVLKRIKDIAEIAISIDQEKLDNIPDFFNVCYSQNVLSYLITARDELCWNNNIVDATLMAIILVNLHGRREQSLSNQMRQGKAMSPEYSINWWKERKLTPPEIDPVEFLNKRVEWRYAKGIPNLKNGKVILGDSTSIISELVQKVSCGKWKPFDLLFTSPPYYRITNYHYDQWLRLWMLGGPNIPTWISNKWQNRFESKTAYRELLQIVFSGCAEIMKTRATIYVRTDARQFTRETTLEVLHDVFPQKSIDIVLQPFKKNTQTALFGDKSKKPGEIDIIMK